MLTDGVCLIDPDALSALPAVDLDPTAPETTLLRAVYQRIAALEAQVVREGGPHLAERLMLVNASELFADVALEAFRDQEVADGIFSLTSATTMLDLATDFLPGASLLKDATIMLQGVNPITGDDATATERVITAATLLIPGFIAGGVKGIVKRADRLERIAQSSRRTARAAQDLQDAVRRSDGELHHIQSIQRGGSVYDMSNLMIVTPRFHQEVLERTYHYGY